MPWTFMTSIIPHFLSHFIFTEQIHQRRSLNGVKNIKVKAFQIRSRGPNKNEVTRKWLNIELRIPSTSSSHTQILRIEFL